MSYLKFDKSQLINLNYSLDKEILRANRAGSYACTSLIGCNTRKYHGLLVSPVDNFGGDKYVLLSSLDATVIQHDKEFRIGIHKYEGDNYSPKGHKYVRDFETDLIPKVIIRVGGVVLSKEKLLVENEEQILIRYTLIDAHSDTLLRLKPYLAFRNAHELTKANMSANTRVDYIKNGIRMKLYEGFPYLNMQLSKESEFVHVPDWDYNIEYIREMERGYDYKEDLFVPGYFEFPIKKGESITFSASTEEINPNGIKQKFTSESKKRVPRESYRNCLINSAQQFIVRRNNKTEIIAGYPWFGSWGRDTFIALPGLTLAIDDRKTFIDVVDTQVAKLKNGLFPNMGNDNSPAFNSVDAPLWFFWAVQQYVKNKTTAKEVWKNYSQAMKGILTAYRDGTGFGIRMADNGLIWAGAEGKALTWMDAVVFGKPVTPRNGFAVEINALWYNAVCFSLELAEQNGDDEFVNGWKNLPEQIKNSFNELFWDEKKGYLADFSDENSTNWYVRPNQVFVSSLKYSPVDLHIQKAVLETIENELLTPRGLRTLSPKNPNYKGIYLGNQEERDSAYHQGTVWPWLLGHFCEGYLKIHKESGLSKVKSLINGFEDEMNKEGIGSISEIYDGDPPHHGKGAISQAWSVSEILRIMKKLEDFTE